MIFFKVDLTGRFKMAISARGFRIAEIGGLILFALLSSVVFGSCRAVLNPIGRGSNYLLPSNSKWSTCRLYKEFLNS